MRKYTLKTSKVKAAKAAAESADEFRSVLQKTIQRLLVVEEQLWKRVWALGDATTESLTLWLNASQQPRTASNQLRTTDKLIATAKFEEAEVAT